MRSRWALPVALIGLIVTDTSGADPRKTLTSDVTADPAEARLIYQDVENFLRAREAMKLQTGYFERATPGLGMFIEKYNLTPDRLKAAMQEHSDAYAALEETLAELRGHEPSFRKLRPEGVRPGRGLSTHVLSGGSPPGDRLRLGRRAAHHHREGDRRVDRGGSSPLSSTR